MWMTGETDVGQKRKSNQDTFLTEQLSGGSGLLLVCDGMGGERGGAVASGLALSAAAESLRRSVGAGMNENSIRRALECAGAAANAAVFDAASQDAALHGMGTTLVGAVVQEDSAHFLHAGDSRAYLLRDDLLTQLTVDHTVVQMLVDRGEISERDAKVHPQRHYITRAVGVGEQLRYDIFSIDLLPGDALLLCSDGLYNYLSHEDLCALAAVALRCGSAKPLIDRANENGGGDNITTVLCRTANREK